MPRDYDNKGLIHIAARAVIDCSLIAKRQIEKKCTGNKLTCRKPGCIYYWREIPCCVGELDEKKNAVIENERCDTCDIQDKPWLHKYCWVMKRRISGKKQR